MKTNFIDGDLKPKRVNDLRLLNYTGVTLRIHAAGGSVRMACTERTRGSDADLVIAPPDSLKVPVEWIQSALAAICIGDTLIDCASGEILFRVEADWICG